MSLNSRLVLLIHNDRSIYRLLLIALCIASPALYYLCHHHSIDPVYLRAINSLTCLITLGLSFLHNRAYFKAGLYTTIILFITVNNFLLLSYNNFANIYMFSSIIVFMGLAFLCTKRYEFWCIAVINTFAVLSAYFLAPVPAIKPLWLTALLVTFFVITYIIFIVRMVYRLKFKKAVDTLTKMNRSLILNEQKLRESRNQLHSLINSIDDIVFEVDEARNVLNVWYSEHKPLHFDPKVFLNNSLASVVGAEKSLPISMAVDFVIQNHQSTTIEFRSIFGADKWYAAKMSPVYNKEGHYTSRISVSITDITSQKNYEQALKDNQELLIEAQEIAKLGNWWYDGDTQENYWSGNIFKILDTEAIPEGVSKYEYYLSHVHPDDLENVRNFFSNIHTGLNKVVEHKIVTPAGALKYLKVICGSILHHDDGSVKRISGVIQDITEIRLSEKSAKISQAELIEAQTIAKIGNWKNELLSGTYTWSAEIASIYEIKLKQVKSRSLIRLFLKYVHPDDRRLMRRFLKNPLKYVGQSFEYRIITQNGSIKYVSIIIGKLMRREGVLRKIIGTLQDVTERKKAELESKRTKNKYQLVLESVKLAALTVNYNGIVTFCNSHLAGLLGYDQHEIIGLNWVNNFINDEFKQTLNEWLVNNTYETHFVTTVVCRAGHELTISWQNTVSFDEHGKISEITSIGEDITDRQKETQKLITAKEDAERSSKFKSDFLSTMSHEIRTPMNAVIGITNLLLAEDPRPEQMEYLQTLKFSGENLLAIINDILDYNKIEAGKFELTKQPVHLLQLIHNIWQSFTVRARQQGIELKLITDSQLPELVLADQVRLSQILNNLIGNSVKFTYKGNVTIKIDKEHEDAATARIRFTITDTGIGIAPESLPYIFDPFVQDTQQQHNFGGTGLGLAITKRLVNLYNGHIEVTSTPGKGTMFTFDIEFNTIKTQKQEAEPSKTSLLHDLRNVHVLVVDDNKMNLLIATKFLKKWHANVDEAGNGQIAVEMAASKNYHMVIMDLQMPVMDGFEATRIIKQSQPHLPIIALTADAMPETYTKAFEAGMTDYLTKPFLPETLFEKVLKHKK